MYAFTFFISVGTVYAYRIIKELNDELSQAVFTNAPLENTVGITAIVLPMGYVIAHVNAVSNYSGMPSNGSGMNCPK